MAEYDESLFFVTVLTDLDLFGALATSTGEEIQSAYQKHHDRAIGYFHTFEDADAAVRANAGDMEEHCHNYAVVEEVWPGVYPRAKQVQWYRWVEGAYVPIATPEAVRQVVNFAIG